MQVFVSGSKIENTYTVVDGIVGNSLGFGATGWD